MREATLPYVRPASLAVDTSAANIPSPTHLHSVYTSPAARSFSLSKKVSALVDAVHLSHTLSYCIAFSSALLTLVLLLTVLLIGSFAASPYGIFFSGQASDSGTIPLSAAINTVNSSLNDALEEIYAAEDFTSVEIDGAPASWEEVLSAFASDYGFSEPICTFTPQLVQKLQDTFWEMTTINHVVEEITEDPVLDENGSVLVEGSTERYLTITLDAQTANDYARSHHFSPDQGQTMQELLSLSDNLMETIGSLSVLSDDAKTVLKRLPSDLSAERRAVLKKACALTGKVPYFWGGCALFLDNLRRNTQ